MHDHDHEGGGHQHDGPGAYDEDFWNERYRATPAVWSGRPNPVLVAEAAGLPPGRALDIGCGEGGDAVWLAEHGWSVTAVDFAVPALERGAARAADLGIGDRITWVHADLTGWEPPAGAYDLVSSQYLHLLVAEQEALVSRLAAAVAPGGTLLYVSHDLSDNEVLDRPHLVARFLPAARIAAGLEPATWEAALTDLRPREATLPDGRRLQIHDNVLRARRRPG